MMMMMGVFYGGRLYVLMNLVFVFDGSVGQAIASLDNSSARVAGLGQALIRKEIRPDRTAGSISNPFEWGLGGGELPGIRRLHAKIRYSGVCSRTMADGIMGVRKVLNLCVRLWKLGKFHSVEEGWAHLYREVR
jgi:hypothetical protein